MAAQPGIDGTDAPNSKTPRAAAPNNEGNVPGAQGKTVFTRVASGSGSASAPARSAQEDANDQLPQAQSASRSLLARWFGVPFMPCFLGLAALRVWLQVNQFGGYAQSDNGIITILSNLTYGLTFLIAAAIAWRKPPTPRAEHAIAFVAAALMLVAPLLMLAGLAPNGGAVATAGALLVGVAGAFGGGMWACAYTRLPLKPALMYAFASLALGSLGGLAVSFLPEGSRYIASLFMPALSLLCFERARAHTGDTPLGKAAANANAGGSEQPNVADAANQAATPNSCAQGENVPASSGSSASKLGTAIQTMRFGKAASRLYDNEPVFSLALIISGIAVFGLALGLSRGFPAGSPVPFGLPVRLVHQLGVVAISAGFLWWIGAKGRHISFSLLWRLELTIAATGAFILMALPGTATEIAVAIVNIADTLMLCVLFITAQDVARHSSLHPFVIFGGAWAARVLSRDFGRTVVLALSPMTQSESAVLGVIVFALSLSMVCLLSDNLPRTRKLFTYDDEPCVSGTAAQTANADHNANVASDPAPFAANSENARRESGNGLAAPTKTTAATAIDTPAQTPAAASANNSPASANASAITSQPEDATPEQHPSALTPSPNEQVREWLRTKHGLTAREIDVALLIAHGRSKTFIANELFISENTVRTHSKNVYAKLGIHSREELISLFENHTHS